SDEDEALVTQVLDRHNQAAGHGSHSDLIRWSGIAEVTSSDKDDANKETSSKDPSIDTAAIENRALTASLLSQSPSSSSVCSTGIAPLKTDDSAQQKRAEHELDTDAIVELLKETSLRPGRSPMRRKKKASKHATGVPPALPRTKAGDDAGARRSTSPHPSKPRNKGKADLSPPRHPGTARAQYRNLSPRQLSPKTERDATLYFGGEQLSPE
ncbi:MAG: hypothetical protein SGILL_010230, partial [Bacillariaceae sp.]